MNIMLAVTDQTGIHGLLALAAAVILAALLVVTEGRYL